MSIVLHVGLPKTGTTYLQGTLASHRDELRARGVLYPFLRPGAQFHAATEVRGSASKFGLDQDMVAGTWQALCEMACAFDGTTILGHEVLGGASPEQIERALIPLAGMDVRIVVSARDLGRQTTAHWQEEVKLGDTGTFAEFEHHALRRDTGRNRDHSADGSRPHFWHAQDFVHALNRWTAPLGAEAGRLVIVPEPGHRPEELWVRFAAAAGIDPEIVDPLAQGANHSLAGPEIALIREVNAALDGRLARSDQLRLVKREWAEGQLAKRPGSYPRAPYGLKPLLDEVTQEWVEEIRQAGYVVHGDLAELDPITGSPSDPPPDVPPHEGDNPEAIAKSFLDQAARDRPSATRCGRLFRRRS